ncbi:MAG: AraC family transcriptional regulator [Allomuricauda sp.]|nr:MAG: AraC family transcriptional regulator [Allomuricauda sp.]
MKVYPFTIPKQPNDNIVVQVDKGQRFYNRLHQHNEIQLSYILSGSGRLILGNHVSTYSPNDLIGIGAGLPHIFQSEASEEKSEMISIFFLKDCFGPGFFSLKEMAVLQSCFEELTQGIKLTSDPHTRQLFQSISSLSKFDTFLSLLEILRRFTSRERIVFNKRGVIPKLSPNQGERLQEVMDFTLTNFDQPITLQQAAEKVHMGRNSFCRFFKQRTNKTYFQFLSEVRIQHASRLLVEEHDMSISEIALQAGYQSISNFNRQFREIHKLSPKAYRIATLTKF